MPKSPSYWPPEQEWEPEPLYLPLDPPPPPEQEDPDEKQQAPSRVIIIDIACPDGAIPMC